MLAKTGIKVHAYRKNRALVITIDLDNKAIVEVKTGPTSKLTANQMINYNAATLGKGTLRGPKAEDAKIDGVAPQVVYILRDTEI